MTLLLGKGVKPVTKGNTVIFKGHTSHYDIGASDLRRLEMAISATKAKMSIYSEDGKITFEFEV